MSAKHTNTNQPKYDRSLTYRTEFIRHWPPVNGKYRCVYCGRKIPKNEMQVDHIIPVAAVKHNLLYRLCCPADGVNSVENLVPSCPKCNQRKGKKTGLWSIRGKYWRICLPIYTILRIVFVLLVVIAFFFYLGLLGIKPCTGFPNFLISMIFH